MRMSSAFVRNYGNLSNEELVEKINSGNSDILQLLIIRHMPLIRRLAAKYARTSDETEDFEQIGLIALCNAVKSYKSDNVSFSYFAGVCIRRALIGERRASGRRRRVPPELVFPLDECDAPAGQTPETILMEKESLIRLTDTIKLELSKLEYRVLQGFLSGASYAVIADQLGISEKSVDNALRRIRGKLKNKRK